VTIVSYDGSLDFGLVACKQAMPDLRQFARHLQGAHQELLKITKTRKGQ
jgi:diacylglycerol O-acyltransferase / wax synthase